MTQNYFLKSLTALCCFGGMLNAQNAVTDDGRIHTTTTTTQTQTQTTARYEQPTHVLSYLCD
ncbi:MAG: hypothetical protein ACRCYO_05740, partial [Bacteroidia bacterium]